MGQKTASGSSNLRRRCQDAFRPRKQGKCSRLVVAATFSCPRKAACKYAVHPMAAIKMMSVGVELKTKRVPSGDIQTPCDGHHALMNEDRILSDWESYRSPRTRTEMRQKLEVAQWRPRRRAIIPTGRTCVRRSPCSRPRPPLGHFPISYALTRATGIDGKRFSTTANSARHLNHNAHKPHTPTWPTPRIH